MRVTTLSAEEIARRGEAIYQERIRPLVEADHHGDYVVIAIDTGDYEVDGDHLTASRRLRARQPHGSRYALRVGHSAAYRLGGASMAGRAT